MEINIIKPKIFPQSKIICGVTLKNETIFPPYGLSISNAKILNTNEVTVHKKAISDFLELPYSSMKFQKQIHSNIIKIVTKKTEIEESDGMISIEKGLLINISIADCAAILIYDPNNEVIAGVHSGWKGTQFKISQKAIKLLIEQYSSNVQELLIYISPCASVEKYEVGKEFKNYFKRNVIEKDEKLFFDNKQEIFDQLIEIGILEKNVEVSQECSIINDNLHSYRRDKDKSGRMSAYIGMKK